MISANTTEIQAIISPNRTVETGARVPQRTPEAEEKKPAEPEKPAVRVDAKAAPDGLADIDAMKEKRNVIAKTVRQVDATMENIDENLNRMKDQLIRIVKQYPPYPPDSQDRVNFLKNFGQMRRLIERLTIPPMIQDANRTNPMMEPPMEEREPSIVDVQREMAEESRGAGAYE